MSPDDPDQRLAAEQRARLLIDRQLTDAGWCVQDKLSLNLFAGQGIACREVVMKTGHGRADYLLYVDKRVVGVIEAKAGRHCPVAASSSGSPPRPPRASPPDGELAGADQVDGRLAFVFEAGGSDSDSTNGFDRAAAAGGPSTFPDDRPPSARDTSRGRRDRGRPSWRGRSAAMPPKLDEPRRPPAWSQIDGDRRRRAEPARAAPPTGASCRWPRERAKPSLR